MEQQGKLKKIKSFYSRISSFIIRYGVFAAVKKTFQKLFPGKRSVNRAKGIQKDVGYIPDVSNDFNNELYLKYPGMTPLHILSTRKRPPTINLVIDNFNAENITGFVATPLVFATLLSKKYDLSLRIITRTERAQKRYFAQALINSGIKYDKDVEFSFSDPKGTDEGILSCEDDIFISTSWWMTRSLMDSYASEKIIYFLQEDERKLYSSGDEFENYLKALNDTNMYFVIHSKELFDLFVSDGFENIANKAQWFEISSNNWNDSFARIYSWLEKRGAIKCIN